MARTPKVVEDRREQIVDAAMRVFAQKGFTRATNKDIAREAGITAGLIYHYFDNKEALLRAIIEERSPIKLLRSLPSETFQLSPETFLRFLIQQVLLVAEGEHFVQLLRVLLPEIIHNPQVSPLGVTVLQEALGFLSHYLAAKMESGELVQTDADLVAQTLIGCIIGFVLRRQILRDSSALQYSHEQIIETLVTTTFYGLLPR